MHSSRPVWLVLAVLLVALLLAGCGDDGGAVTEEESHTSSAAIEANCLTLITDSDQAFIVRNPTRNEIDLRGFVLEVTDDNGVQRQHPIGDYVALDSFDGVLPPIACIGIAQDEALVVNNPNCTPPYLSYSFSIEPEKVFWYDSSSRHRSIVRVLRDGALLKTCPNQDTPCVIDLPECKGTPTNTPTPSTNTPSPTPTIEPTPSNTPTPPSPLLPPFMKCSEGHVVTLGEPIDVYFTSQTPDNQRHCLALQVATAGQFRVVLRNDNAYYTDHWFIWDYIGLMSREGEQWGVGLNETPPDYGPTAFDEFCDPKERECETHYIVAKSGSDAAPNLANEMNDWSITQVEIEFDITADQVGQPLYLVLSTLYSTHDGSAGYRLSATVVQDE